MPIDVPASSGAPHASPPYAAKPAPSRRGLKIAAVAGVCIAAVVVITGILGRNHEHAQVKTWTSAQAIPAVSVISPTVETGAQALVLPGNLQAFYNAQIYSRVSGYVHGWYQDIGARVKSGQLLATIDTPELDQQLIQARADLESAQATMQLASTTAKRWSTLLAKDAVSKQESDEKSGDYLVKSALVHAAQANVNRLLAMKGFARIVAPFEGVVTARRTDIGALVNAGAGATPSSELFDVAKVDKLRLYVRVPQSYSARITPGTKAVITVPEYPGRTFTAALTTTANAVSDSSGTLLVQMAVDNPDDALKSGDYAQVKFDLPNSGAGGGGMLRLPSSALLFRKTGLEAAVVGPDDHVRLQRVTVGRDLGTVMEIAGGLKPSDRVIDNPPDSIGDGQLVRVISSSAKPSAESAHAAG
ncbi:efflux RND transporter periplasmic adaptor subunit [Caulobacter sp. S45]|uniref:efflux RND transporter periplasmic adaptor subunit n=1 Tax=Caulobacter sp. S45 TaxID=1641861 RepID=UPI00131E4114|nr:efflux RND transporter periplasmic adaptor subunit [Caulobacter sp. S45]